MVTPTNPPPAAPDFVLKDDQNVDLEVVLFDKAGNTVAGADVDAGTLAVADSENGANALVTPSADQSSINVKALGSLVTGDTLTVSGSYQGAALQSGTFVFDVDTDLPASIGLIPGTPVSN